MSSPRLTLILAATASNGIGKANALPWKLPKEMAYFSRVTNFVSSDDTPQSTSTSPTPNADADADVGTSTSTSTKMNKINAVVMGRKSWEAIPDKYRPLAGRVNVVVSRNGEYTISQEDCKSTPTQLYTTSLSNAIRSISPSLSSSSSSSSASQTQTQTQTQTHDTSPAFSSHPSHMPISLNKIFIIGGGALYTASLSLRTPTDGAFADRILLTRIIEPEWDCDVFFPDFLKDNNNNNNIDNHNPRGVEAEVGPWRRASHEELEGWVGFEVPRGVVEERGAKYEFQMWVREEVC